MTIDIALIIAFVGIMCLLLCSSRRDEMLWRWMPHWVCWLVYRWTGWRLKRYRYRNSQQMLWTWYEWRRK